MTTSRRDLLRFAALGAAAGTFSSFRPLRAMCGRSFLPQTNDKLVVLFLRGAMDALYTVAPDGDSTYHQLRSGLLTPLGSNPYYLDAANFAALSDNFRILTMANGPLANQHARFVLEIGNPDGHRSHFDEWEILERALQPNGFGLAEDGVFARLAKQATFDPTLPMASVGPNLQRWFRSPDLPAAHVKSLQEYDLGHEDVTYGPYNISASMGGLVAGTTFADDVAGGMNAHYGQSAPTISPGKEAHGVGEFLLGSLPVVAQVASAASHSPSQFPTSLADLGMQPAGEPTLTPDNQGYYLMQRCEQAVQLLENSTCSVVGVDVYGWDTHVDQANQRDLLDPWLAKAMHSLYLRSLGLGASGHPTTVLVVTEFGRTNIVNGNGGTDHGVGGIWMALGATVKGAIKLSNMNPSTWKPLNQPSTHPIYGAQWNDALEVKTDFRTVLRELFRKRFALNAAQMAMALPQAPFAGFDQSLDLFV